MGASINTVVLVGRLARTPELSRTTTGKSVCRFTLAIDRPMAKKDDSQQQTADFISCTAWNKTAENLYQYCRKGSLIGVEGTVHTGNYTNKQGQKIYTTDIFCDRLTFMETKSAAESKQTTQPAGSSGNQESEAVNSISKAAQDPASQVCNAKQIGADEMLWGNETSQSQTSMPDISDDDLPF